MTAFHIEAIGHDTAAEVRATLLAPGYGHRVHRETARGTGPCRACLSAFAIGREDRLLFTHDPFAGTGHLPQPGPVFIHADPCIAPAGDAYPTGLAGIPVRAEIHYVDDTTSASRALVPGHETETIRALLDEPGADFLHLRHAEAGCFIARVVRPGR